MTNLRHIATPRLAVLGMAMLVMMVALASCDWGSTSEALRRTVDGEVQLSTDSPSAIIELEGTFVARASSGIFGRASRVSPEDSEALDALGVSTKWEYWDGRIWQTRFSAQPAESGANTFLYRWTFTLVEGVREATVPFEVAFEPIADTQPPIEEDEVSSVALRIVDIIHE